MSSKTSPTHILFLTNIRSSQHDRVSNKIVEAIKTTKQKMMGKNFKVRYEPPIYCRKKAIAKIERTSEGEIVKATLLKAACKSWTCPRCNLVKALKVKYMIKETAILNNLEYFLTLTLDPKKIPEYYLSKTSNNTHQYITKLFNIFITDLKRRTKAKIKYIWVLEFQKNGNAHLHILLNNFISINLIREIWTRIGGRHIMRIENVKTTAGISSYLSEIYCKRIKTRYYTKKLL